MNYLIYDKSNGRVIQMASGPEGSMAEFITDTTDILPGDDPDVYVQDGVAVVIPDSPNPIYTFNYTTKAWEDPRTLQEQKDAKWEEIKAIRTAIEFGPFMYADMEFDGDSDAQRRLSGYVSQARAADPEDDMFIAMFFLADNTVAPLSGEDFIAIELAKVQQVNDAFSYAAELRSAIDAATTSAQIASITW